MLIERKKTNILRFKIADGDPEPGLTSSALRSVIITPGMNIVDEKDVKILEKNFPLWNELIEEGVHKVHRALGEDGKEVKKTDGQEDFGEMKLKEALAAIKKTFSLDVLDRMMDIEMAGRGRGKILRAIDEQIHEMKKKPDDGK